MAKRLNGGQVIRRLLGGSLESYTFEGQKEDEIILLLLRKHPWVLSRPLFRILILALIVVAVFIFAGPSWIFFWIFFPALLLGGLYGWNSWFVWWNDLYLVTNLRLIDVSQRSLFHRKISEISLEQITQVTYEIKGVARTFLNYGNLLVKTLGNEEALEILDIDDPYAAQQKILRIQEQYKKEGPASFLKPRKQKVILR